MDDSSKKSVMFLLTNRFKHILYTPLRWMDSFRLRRDRHLSQGGFWTLWILTFFSLLIMACVVLGLWAYYGGYRFFGGVETPDYAQLTFKPKNIIDAAYYLLITNGGQNLFEGSHLWGAVITSVGIFLIAFLTSALTSLMERRAERYLSGESSYRLKNHIVIFGASDYLYSIIREKTKHRETGFWKKFAVLLHPQRFLIVTTKDVKAVRREVFSFLEKGAHKKKFVFLFGERTSPEDISHLSLEYAKEVFIIGDSEESDDYESYRDANNMDCVKEIGNYLDRVAYRDTPLIRNEKLKVALDAEGKPFLERDSCWKVLMLMISKAWARLMRRERTEPKGIDPPVKAVIRHIRENSPKPLICHVMFEYQTSFAAFQFSEPRVSARLDFRPFNYYDLWAQKMLVTKGEGLYRHKYLDTIVDEEEDMKNGNTNEGEKKDEEEECIIEKLKRWFDILKKAQEPEQGDNDQKIRKEYIRADSKETVHLIILGMSKMGIAMGIQAAHVCHYPNFMVYNKGEEDEAKMEEERKKVAHRTRITFIDANADIEMDYLKGRFPSLMSEVRTCYKDHIKSASCKEVWQGDENDWYDTELEFIKGRIESPQIQDYIEKAATQESRIVTIAVCLPKSHQSLAASMYMREKVYANVLQIFTFQRYSGTIVKELAMTKKGRYQKIVPFGMMECGYDSSLDDDTRAMLVSYVYDSAYAVEKVVAKEKDEDEKKKKVVTYSIEGHSYEGPDTLFDRFKGYKEGEYCVYPDYSYRWPAKSIYDRLSSAYNANTIGSKLRGIGILDEQVQPLTEKEFKNIETEINNKIVLLANMEHNRWNLEKMLTGYRALNKSEAIEMETLRQEVTNPAITQPIIDKRKKEWNELTGKEWDPKEKFTIGELWSIKRRILKDHPLRAHLDICSVEALYNREKESTIKMDENLCRAIPYILKTERMMKERCPEKKRKK